MDGSYDVLLRLDPAQRTQRDDVMQIDLPAQSGRVLAPLSQVARVEKGTAPSKIRRRDLMREIRISANAQGRSLGEVIADIQQGRE